MIQTHWWLWVKTHWTSEFRDVA